MEIKKKCWIWILTLDYLSLLIIFSIVLVREVFPGCKLSLVKELNGIHSFQSFDFLLHSVAMGTSYPMDLLAGYKNSWNYFQYHFWQEKVMISKELDWTAHSSVCYDGQKMAVYWMVKDLTLDFDFLILKTCSVVHFDFQMETF